jgi:hypothetical protein
MKITRWVLSIRKRKRAKRLRDLLIKQYDFLLFLNVSKDEISQKRKLDTVIATYDYDQLTWRNI